MAVRSLNVETVLDAPLATVFDFFSRAENLERITPTKLRFEILTPLPIQMRPGALIDYKLRLFGFPMYWTTEITVWEPGVRFVDVQRKGPYKLWEHEHRFEAMDDKTRMTDSLRYEAPGGVLEPLVHALFVRRQVEAIFSHRAKVIKELF